MLSKMIQPKRILEIGTYTGYSALCLAEGLTSDGKLVTIDVNEELANRVQAYFDASEYSTQIQYLISPALEVIPTLNETWDLVFIDADKQNYIEYYELILPLMRSGGYVILDNVLWSGKVVDQDKNDKDTTLLRKLNAIIHDDVRVEEVLLPIRDGLMVARKK
jgi:predicted O-methyltransferase YrrM